MNRRTIAALAVVGLVLLGGVATVAAQSQDSPTTTNETTTTSEDAERSTAAADRWDRLQRYFELTDEQVRTLQGIVAGERADGARPAEVREAVVDQLRAFGVDEEKLDAFENRLDARSRRGSHERSTVAPHRHAHGGYAGAHVLWIGLSEEERSTLDAEIDGMQESGASRAEVTRFVRDRLVELNSDDLADDQLVSARVWFAAVASDLHLRPYEVGDVAETVREARQDNATASEIRTAVHDQLVSEFGIDEARVDRAYVKGYFKAIWLQYDLTREEMRTVVTDARDLRQDGNSLAEIRDHVAELVDEFDGE